MNCHCYNAVGFDHSVAFSNALQPSGDFLDKFLNDLFKIVTILFKFLLLLLLTYIRHILFFFFLLRLHSQHMEVPRLGVELELHLPAYTTATAVLDPSHIHDLCCSSQQHQTLT